MRFALNPQEIATPNDAMGPNPCAYQALCGPANNIVAVKRKKVKGTKNVRDDYGTSARTKLAGELTVHEYVAAMVDTESEAWVIGKVVRTLWTQADCGQVVNGKRGERIEPSTQYFTIRKMDKGLAPAGGIASDFYYLEVEGDEGLLVVPATGLLVRGLVLVLPEMSWKAKEEALGEKEWGAMDRIATLAMFQSLYTYLPQRERLRIWERCPQ